MPYDTNTEEALGRDTADVMNEDAVRPSASEVIAEFARPWYKRKDRLIQISGALATVVIFAVGGVLAIRASNAQDAANGRDFAVTQVPLKPGDDSTATTPILSVNGQLQVSESLVLAPSTLPGKPTTGQLYYDKTANQLSYYNGKLFVSVGGSTIQTTIGGNTSLTNVTNVTNITNVAGSTGSGTVTTTGGTPGAIVKFTGGQTAGDSILSDDGSTVTIKGNTDLISSSSGAIPEYSGWASSVVPAGIVDVDELSGQGVELGVKFKADYNGQVRGVRFYKSAANVGVHTGSLWTTGGTRLATVTFTGETGSGWQEARFSTPVSIAGDTTYIISYRVETTAGKLHYSVDQSYLAATGVDNGPLHIMQDGFDGSNGLFRYGPISAFPTSAYSASNYWVDVIYAPTALPAQYRVDGAQLSSINLANNGDLAKRSSGQVFSGNNTFRSAVNGVAFQIQSANTSPLLTADTAAMQLVVGNSTGSTSPVLLFLANKSTTNDPIAAPGAMYYNSALGSFRCASDTDWFSCGDLNVQHNYTVYDEFMGGNLSTLANPVGGQGWNPYAIGSNGSVSANPAVPAPSTDRPGILALKTPASANQGTTLALSSGSNGSVILAKDTEIRAAVAVGAASGSVLRIGVYPQGSGTARPISGVWWEADASANANWQWCYGNGAAAVCAPSTVLITADVWETLRIRIKSTTALASEATYYISDPSNNNLYSVSSSAPTIGTSQTSPALSCFTKIATAQDCYWDYFYLSGVATSRR